MRKFIKILAVSLGCVIAAGACGALTGCVKGKKDTENFLEIQAYDRGYGTAGLRAVAARYAELHEDVEIDIEGVVDSSLATDIYAGPGASTIDLYFNGGNNIYNLVTGGEAVIDGVTYPNYFEPLTEVYNHIPEGETLAIKDKMLDSYEFVFNLKNVDEEKWTEDTYYSAAWMGGNIGIVYNSKMFRDHEWEVPVTTDGLLELCDDILDDEFYSTNKNSTGQPIEVVPFSYCLSDSYWMYVYPQWWAQYDGVQSYINFFKGEDINGAHTYEIANTNGRREMIKLMDQLLGTYEMIGSEKVARSNVYCDPTLATRTFIDTQSTFLNAERARINTNGATTSAMMPNGDWLESEMSQNFESQIASGEIEFKMMKTPVISAIIKHPDCENSITNDTELKALVKAIDAGETALSSTEYGYDVTQSAYDKVKEARRLTLGNYNNNIYIPAFATAKELAKDFLKFYFSDEGVKIFAEATKGQNLPVKYDFTQVNNISAFYQSKFDVIDDIDNFIGIYDVYPAVYLGNLTMFPEYLPFESKFNVSSAADYLSPDKVFIDNYNAIKRLWPNIVKDAGLN